MRPCTVKVSSSYLPVEFCSDIYNASTKTTVLLRTIAALHPVLLLLVL